MTNPNDWTSENAQEKFSGIFDSSNQLGQSCTGGGVGVNNLGYSYYWPYWHTCGCTKTKIKLSDIQLVRDFVRDNDAVRKILNQLSGHIEVEVDF